MAQVKRLGQDPRAFRGKTLVVDGDRGEPGDEHDLDPGLAGGHAARQLDTIDPGHHDIGDEEVVVGIERLYERRLAIGDRIDRVAGTPQPAPQKCAQLIIVFGEKDSRHRSKTSR
jgi:hypothetical protein